MSYRNFLELLSSKGIPIESLNKDELKEQFSALKNLLEKNKLKKCQAGLGKSKFYMSADFDEFLPNDFWLCEE